MFSDNNTQTETAPLSRLWVELTEKCNLNCKHCYALSTPDAHLTGRMEKSDWLAVIKGARERGCQDIQFIGGEPTLHPNFSDLVQCAGDLGFSSISIFSNATGISDAKIRCILQNDATFCFSIYSDMDEIHDGITRKPGSLKMLKQTVHRLVAHGVRVSAGFIEMAENQGHFKRTRDFLQSIGVWSVGRDRVRAIGRGANLRDGPWSFEGIGDVCGNCWRGRLCVTSEGIAFPCVMSRMHPVGNVLEDGFSAVVCSSKLATFRKDLKASAVTLDAAALGIDCNPGECSPKNECVPDDYDCGPYTICGNCKPDGCTPND